MLFHPGQHVLPFGITVHMTPTFPYSYGPQLDFPNFEFKAYFLVILGVQILEITHWVVQDSLI